MEQRLTPTDTLLALRDERGFSFPEIGARLGISPDAARGRYRRATGNRLAHRDGPLPTAEGRPAVPPDAPLSVQLAHYPTPSACPNFDAIHQRPVLDTKRVIERAIADLENRPRLRLAIISDTHGYNMDRAAFDWALRTIAEEGAEAGIHGGDVFDYNNQSDAHAATEYVPWEEELDGGGLTLRALEDTGLPWLLLEANHDLRPNKQYAARLPRHYLDWVESPQRSLVDRLPNVWLPDRPSFQAWWIRLGDTIVAHTELAAGVQSVAKRGYDTFDARGDDFGLDASRIRGFFAGHPHKFRQEYIGRRAVLVDLDCLQRVPTYAVTGPGVKYKGAATQGIVFATLNFGRLDIDSVTHRVYLP